MPWARLSMSRPTGPIRCMVCWSPQDTGGAIRGGARADIFFGFGPDAERRAGQMKAPGTILCAAAECAGGRIGAARDALRHDPAHHQREERKLFEQNFKRGASDQDGAVQGAPQKQSGGSGPSGVNGATQDRLRRGLMEPDARIDLHGMTQARGPSHPVHLAGRGACAGYRLVLVVTGKGNPKNDENAPWMMSPHGVLKQMVPRWLNEPELAALIASVQPAHVKHGGDGALYVYLRKSRDEAGLSHPHGSDQRTGAV